MNDHNRHGCKHFNGLQHDKCSLGIRYYDVADRPGDKGMAQRVPCILLRTSNPLERGHCEHYCELTTEEIEKRDAAFREYFKKMKAARAVIVEQIKPGDVGILECPACGNVLHASIATNGHVRAQCETNGCLLWLE